MLTEPDDDDDDEEEDDDEDRGDRNSLFSTNEEETGGTWCGGGGVDELIKWLRGDGFISIKLCATTMSLITVLLLPSFVSAHDDERSQVKFKSKFKLNN